MVKSQLIISTFLNSINKPNSDLKTLSNDELHLLISSLLKVLDDDDSLVTSTLTTDTSINQMINTNTWLKNLVDQHDLLIKTMCMHQQNLLNSSNIKLLSDDISKSTTTPHVNKLQIPKTNSLSHPVAFDDTILNQNKTSTPIKSDSNHMLTVSKTSTPPIPIIISGTSITRTLEQGNCMLNDRLFNVQVRTKPSCTIEQMQELVKLKHFGKPQGLILSIGTINMKYDNPDVALDKTLNLIREFKHAYPDTKLILTTLPPLGILGLKPSVEQVRADIDEYNSRLLALNGDIDVIKVGFNENMLLRDGIHLNSSGTKELTRAIDDYLKKWV